ncbi:regulatory protein RecX [Marinospirillum insulare]|uniref:Regulatory protein RecX n=1 Tax=Marinospirillum insulare TaxID=217169 RepID=A0ABQ5ZTJ2_9GAMM|nr:regulatory protein RecX [Marinospirillum insulare]GLR62747.1 regulatory protein RecX [Marinospirillum insulare]
MQDDLALDWIKARRERAFRLLAAREQSLHELQEKLLKPTSAETANPEKTPSQAKCTELIDQLIDWLLEHDLQSDERFIESLTNKYLRQGKGPLALQQGYWKHQLDKDLITQQLKRLEPLWYAQVMRVREKRFGHLAPSDQREAAKMQRFLASRGFTPDQIRQAVFLD